MDGASASSALGAGKRTDRYGAGAHFLRKSVTDLTIPYS